MSEVKKLDDEMLENVSGGISINKIQRDIEKPGETTKDRIKVRDRVKDRAKGRERVKSRFM